MINPKDHPVEWALFLYELEDAEEHLKNLIMQLYSKSDIDEMEFKTHLFHVYEHLNRAWHSRNTIDEFPVLNGKLIISFQPVLNFLKIEK